MFGWLLVGLCNFDGSVIKCYLHFHEPGVMEKALFLCTCDFGVTNTHSFVYICYSFQFANIQLLGAEGDETILHMFFLP